MHKCQMSHRQSFDYFQLEAQIIIHFYSIGDIPKHEIRCGKIFDVKYGKNLIDNS